MHNITSWALNPITQEPGPQPDPNLVPFCRRCPDQIHDRRTVPHPRGATKVGLDLLTPINHNYTDAGCLIRPAILSVISWREPSPHQHATQVNRGIEHHGTPVAASDTGCKPKKAQRTSCTTEVIRASLTSLRAAPSSLRAGEHVLMLKLWIADVVSTNMSPSMLF